MTALPAFAVLKPFFTLLKAALVKENKTSDLKNAVKAFLVWQTVVTLLF